jgi:hypothetical protein
LGFDICLIQFIGFVEGVDAEEGNGGKICIDELSGGDQAVTLGVTFKNRGELGLRVKIFEIGVVMKKSRFTDGNFVENPILWHNSTI